MSLPAHQKRVKRPEQGQPGTWEEGAVDVVEALLCEDSWGTFRLEPPVESSHLGNSEPEGEMINTVEGLGSHPVLVARDWRLSGLCLWGKRSGSCSIGFRVSLSSSDSTVEIPNKDFRHFWPGSVEFNWLTRYFPYRGQIHVRTRSSLSWQWSSPWSSQGAVCVQNLKTWRSSHSQLLEKTLEHW